MATVEVVQSESTYVLTLNAEEAGFLKWVLGSLSSFSGPDSLYRSMKEITAIKPTTNPFTVVDTEDWTTP